MKFNNSENYKNVGGIYQIRNLINGKLYIGSSINIKRRFWNHNNALIKNKHYNNYLQSSWNKYGSDNFIFEVLEHVVDHKKLINREQFYLDMHPKSKKYNFMPNAGNNLGWVPSDIVRQKISEANGVPVYQLSPEDGSIIERFNSITIAATETNTPDSNISNVCRGVHNTAGGYSWIYCEDYDNGIRRDPCRVGIEQPVYKISTSSIEIIGEYESISQASRETGLSISAIFSACAGVTKTCGGFFWVYINDWSEDIVLKIPNGNRREVVQFSTDTGLLIDTFESITEAARITGSHASAISHACTGKSKFSNGYGWAYADEFVSGNKITTVWGKGVYQIDIKTKEIIGKFDNITQAGNLTGTSGSSISAVCLGKLKSAGGFCWVYEDDYKEGMELNTSGALRTAVCQLLPKTLEIINWFDSITDASIETGVMGSAISQVIAKKATSAGGYWWISYELLYKFIGEDIYIGKMLSQKAIDKFIRQNKIKTPVYQFTLHGELIDKFESVAEASRETGVSLTSIRYVCYGRSKSAGGFYWQYAD